MTMHDVGVVFMWAIGYYFAGFVLFYLLCGVAYVGNAVVVVLESCIDKSSIEAQQLQVNIHKMCSKVYYPFVVPIVVVLITLYTVIACIVLPYMIYIHRIKPMLKAIKFNSNYKLLPTWASNDSMASFLNKLIGRKHVQ